MRAIVIGIAWALVASGAVAAPAAPPRLFLSPSGEPFRLAPDDPDPLKAWFDQADSKHQGFIDKDEFRADALRFFKALDKNGDGVIDGFETANYESKVVPELRDEVYGSAPPDAEGRGEHPHGAKGDHRRGEPAGEAKADAKGRHTGPSMAQLINEPEPVSGADFNLDSHITLAEWMTATDQRFAILDAAKTGRLTLEALRTRLIAQPRPGVGRQRPRTGGAD